MKCVKPTKPSQFSFSHGKLLLKCCDSGVHEVSFITNLNGERRFSPSVGPEITQVSEVCKNENKLNDPASLCAKWLNQYFKDPHNLEGFQLPHLCPLAEEKFYSKVWKELFSSVGVGQTITYKELAMKVNSPGAARAVGSAMKNNPICILVPCHRVVKSDGIGQYSGGEGFKEWLLKHEQVDLLALAKKSGK